MIKTKTIPIELMRQRLALKGKGLVWLDGKRKGREAGTLLNSGYKTIMFNNVDYSVHRVVYSMVNGAIPDGKHIDHINRDKVDNRPENLRLATPSENTLNQNRKVNQWGLSGLCKTDKGYQLGIRFKGERCYIGSFKTVTDAKSAYKEWRLTHSEEDNAKFFENKKHKLVKKNKVLEPSQAELRTKFDYRDGNFYIGDILCGALTGGGYKSIHIGGKRILTHRAIFIYHNGEIPKNYVIDHINGEPLDNRIENLRAVSKSQNNQNSKINVANTSGTIGVSFQKASQKWKSSIKLKGKDKYLGYFTDKDDAIKARKDAEIKYNFNSREIAA